MTRKEIQDAIKNKKAEIKHLESEIYLLRQQDVLLCDDDQWFIEEVKSVVIKKRPKITEDKLIGVVHWREDFKDEDTGEIITIDRSRVVRVDGEWI